MPRHAAVTCRIRRAGAPRPWSRAGRPRRGPSARDRGNCRRRPGCRGRAHRPNRCERPRRSFLMKTLRPGASSLGNFAVRVIVVDLRRPSRPWRERDVEVVVEVAAERRHPFEFPAHALLVGLDLGERRARHHHQRDVALGEMNRRRRRNDRPGYEQLGQPASQPGPSMK